VTRTFDKSDVATILAALRSFQNNYRGKDAKLIRNDWPEHFTDENGRPIKPLGSEDIDTLCQEINGIGILLAEVAS
jgi:hypothetical protein